MRQFAENSERTPCICITHSASMDDGDHSECPVELLACPEHREQQLRQMSEFSTSEESAANARILASLQDKIHAAASSRVQCRYGNELVKRILIGNDFTATGH